MIANLQTGYVALLLWSVPTYLTWLWWLHQIDQTQETRVKWGLVLLTTAASIFWFFLWPTVYMLGPKKRERPEE